MSKFMRTQEQIVGYVHTPRCRTHIGHAHANKHHDSEHALTVLFLTRLRLPLYIGTMQAPTINFPNVQAGIWQGMSYFNSNAYQASVLNCRGWAS